MINPETHYPARVAEIEATASAPGGIVLLGASHMEWFPTDRLLPGLPIHNHGIASDRLGLTGRGVLQRLELVFKAAPETVVFQSGGNDLGELWRSGTPTLDQIREIYSEVVERLHANLPHARLILINCLPARDTFDGLNPFICEFNPHVASMANKYGLPLLDAHTLLVNEVGCLPSEYTTDGLHLNDGGYELLAVSLQPLMTQDSVSVLPAPM